MKPYTGLVIDGPAEGQIITVQRTPLLTYEQGADDPIAAEVQVKPITYHPQLFRIGGRVYRLFSRTAEGWALDPDTATLALIDADPQDARRCEVTA